MARDDEDQTPGGERGAEAVARAEAETRLLIDDDAGIAAAILILRQSAIFAHVHDDLDRLPGLTGVRAAAESDVNVFL